MDAEADGTQTRTLVVVAVGAFLLGAIVTSGAWSLVVAAQSGGPVPTTGPTPDGDPETPAPTAPGPATGAAEPSPADCGDATVVVDSAASLQSALDAAQPGDVIVLAPGRYIGNFAMTASGRADAPITLCGSRESILDGGDHDDGYVVHLDGARYWRLVGFTVTNGQKGVMADATVGSTIESLTVTAIGDEAIHLRRGSTDNRVVGNDISGTGLRREKFGEGVYIGTAESNWCDISECRPDHSDRNVVEGNVIHGTTAEAIDIKEGTTGGVVRDNVFDGSALVEDGADSWVDVKGNDWLIEGNTGRNSPMDGFQTHEIVDGWGTRNVFRGNTAVVNGPGYGYSLTPARDNVVACDNAASGAGGGVSNVSCRPG